MTDEATQVEEDGEEKTVVPAPYAVGVDHKDAVVECEYHGELHVPDVVLVAKSGGTAWVLKDEFEPLYCPECLAFVKSKNDIEAPPRQIIKAHLMDGFERMKDCYRDTGLEVEVEHYEDEDGERQSYMILPGSETPSGEVLAEDIKEFDQ